MLDWSKPLKTQDGRKARLLGTVANYPYTHAVAVMNAEGEEIVESYTDAGRFSEYGENADLDLSNDNRSSVFYTFALRGYQNEPHVGGLRSKTLAEAEDLFGDDGYWDGTIELIAEDGRLVDVKFYPRGGAA